MTTTPVANLPDPGLGGDLHDWLAKLRDRAPVLPGRSPDGRPMWYITRAEQIRSVLSDPRFVTRLAPEPGIADPLVAGLGALGIPDDLIGHITGMLVHLAGAEHRRLRKLTSSAFTGRRVMEFRPRVQELTDELLDELDAAAEPVDLVGGFGYPLTTGVICELVGIPSSHRTQWREWSEALVAMDLTRAPTALRGMVDLVRVLISDRRGSPGDDVVTFLLEAGTDDGKRLTEDEIVTQVISLVFAGLETTAHLIGNSIVALLEKADQIRTLVHEPRYWPAAVNELVRLFTPFPILPLRYATEDVAIDGHLIRMGDAVQVVIASANWDPREYDDPGRFDVTRQHESDGPGNLSFGHGIHYCMGAVLAKVEVEVALTTLFSRFPDIALAGRPEPAPSPTMIRLARLPISLHGTTAK